VETALRKKQAAVSAAIIVEPLHYLVKRSGLLESGKEGRISLSSWIPFYEPDEESLDLTLMRLCKYTTLE
jgi:hypothetical protein